MAQTAVALCARVHLRRKDFEQFVPAPAAAERGDKPVRQHVGPSFAHHLRRGGHELGVRIRAERRQDAAGRLDVVAAHADD